MSSIETYRPVRGVKGAGAVTTLAGLVLIVAGVLVWILVSTQLADQRITVSDDASMLAGQQVRGPFTAYAQAEVIDEHALAASDGKTYAELGQEDPVRETVMNASFLRASLFTSVVAFGICALVIGLGIVFLVVGGALRRLATAEAIASRAP
ncbi:aromatic ring-opening dioxygenase LigA [Antribacter gilvus]|uniref:aromatic ring-opening dioxygenase LigA n=1 Tax=Antribacter gilvus TaxID=2304675 RepID=UPI000F768D76|nr:aromatic ring-opening dioxygenase LigA [Antribacter gilvus]